MNKEKERVAHELKPIDKNYAQLHIDALKDIHHLLEEVLITRTPIDMTVQISATQAWPVDYRNRKHVFLWLPVGLTLSFEDFGSGPVAAQQWVNVGIPPGTRMLAPGQANPTYIMIRCTDEVIP